MNKRIRKKVNRRISSTYFDPKNFSCRTTHYFKKFCRMNNISGETIPLILEAIKDPDQWRPVFRADIKDIHTNEILYTKEFMDFPIKLPCSNESNKHFRNRLLDWIFDNIIPISNQIDNSEIGLSMKQTISLSYYLAIGLI